MNNRRTRSQILVSSHGGTTQRLAILDTNEKRVAFWSRSDEETKNVLAQLKKAHGGSFAILNQHVFD